MNDGGFAYPSVHEIDYIPSGPPGSIITSEKMQVVNPGMSLRDHFAGLAMQAILTATWGTPTNPERPPDLYFERVAAWSLAMSGAVLAERAKEKP